MASHCGTMRYRNIGLRKERRHCNGDFSDKAGVNSMWLSLLPPGCLIRLSRWPYYVISGYLPNAGPHVVSRSLS